MVIEEAVPFFTGSQPRISRFALGVVRVQAAGYYAAVGAGFGRRGAAQQGARS